MPHCLEQCQTEGGDNIFADGVNVALQLRDANPGHFDILTQTPVDFVDEGTDYVKFHKIQTESCDNVGTCKAFCKWWFII